MKHNTFLVKPASSLCDLRCRYCFYADELDNREIRSYGKMSLDTMHTIVDKAMEYGDYECTIAFQGGEPTLRGIDFFEKVVEFEKQYTVNDQFIYVNPLVFLHVSESPFKQSERKLPVEFPYTDQVSLTINLTIPEGYTVDEKPENQRLQTSDGQVLCRYIITQQNNQVTLRYSFRLQKLLFLHTDYPELQQLWELIAKKNNEMMVLKKL